MPDVAIQAPPTGATVPSGIGLPLAVVAGCLYACAANLSSWVAKGASSRAGRRERRGHKVVLDAVAFMGYVVGGLLITAAYASGDPVPVVNATMVATNLLGNMLLQSVLGLTYYGKEMRVGTFVFVLAVYQLAYLGPTPRQDTDIVALFSEPVSLMWFVALAAATAGGFVGIGATRAHPPESISKILVWSVLISCLGSLTDNGASSFGLLHGSVLVVALGVYGVAGGVILLLSSRAPAICEASLYVPLQLCLQMIFNMVTGLCVWGDRLRIELLGPYIATFAICVLSVYLTSGNVDLVASGSMRLYAFNGKPAQSRFGRSVLELVESWQRLAQRGGWTQGAQEGGGDAGGDTTASAEAKDALASMLRAGLDRGLFHPPGLVNLAVDLNRDQGGGAATATLVAWLEQTPYFQDLRVWNPEVHKAIRQALPIAERDRLLQFVAAGEADSALEDLSSFSSSESGSDADVPPGGGPSSYIPGLLTSLKTN